MNVNGKNIQGFCIKLSQIVVEPGLWRNKCVNSDRVQEYVYKTQQSMNEKYVDECMCSGENDGERREFSILFAVGGRWFRGLW